MTQKEMMIYDQLVELGVATANELNLARGIMAGSWTEILEAVIFCKTGYRTFEQMIECEMEEW